MQAPPPQPQPEAEIPREQVVPEDKKAIVVPDGEEEDSRQAPLPEERMQQWMFDGMKAFGEGTYERAAELFLKVAMEDPENVDATLAYAVARFATGDYHISAIAIRRGVRTFPEVVNSAFDIRDRYGKIDDFDSHLKRLEEYVRQNPQEVDGWLVLGFVRHFMQDREMAGRTFEILKRRSPEDVELAETFLKAKSVQEVLKELEEQEKAAAEAAKQAESQPPATQPAR